MLGESTQEDDEQPNVPEQSPISLLFCDSEEEVVKQIRVVYGGNRSQLARVRCPWCTS